MDKVIRWLMLCSIIMSAVCASNPQYYPVYRGISEPIVVSERVGEVIDTEERAYFDLFQGIDDYKEAIFFKITGYGYDAVVTTETHTFTCLNRDPVAIDLLRDYVDRYDEIEFARRAFEKKWKIVGYDTLGFALTEHEVDKIKDKHIPALYGMCGCLSGSCAGLYLGYQLTEKEYSTFCAGDYPVSLDLMISGFVVGGIGGCMTTWLVTKAGLNAQAIQTIKQYRQPQILE